jgi:hypothetical protein
MVSVRVSLTGCEEIGQASSSGSPALPGSAASAAALVSSIAVAVGLVGGGTSIRVGSV